jgi:hypothetical protein
MIANLRESLDVFDLPIAEPRKELMQRFVRFEMVRRERIEIAAFLLFLDTDLDDLGGLKNIGHVGTSLST